MAANQEKLTDGRGADGIPLESSYAKMAPAPNSILAVYSTYVTCFMIPGIVGGLVAALYVKEPTVLAKIGKIVENDLGPLYLSFIVLVYCGLFINANLGYYRRATRINLPDQQCYRVYGQKETPYVLMETAGDIGKFNRAQRAVASLAEQLPVILVVVVSVAFVFPWTCASVFTLFSIEKVFGAYGYTEETEKRSGMLSYVLVGTMNGLCLVIGILATFKTTV